MIYGKEFAETFKNARETPEYWMEGFRLDFLEDLQRTMKEKQISQKDLAEKIGKTSQIRVVFQREKYSMKHSIFGVQLRDAKPDGKTCQRCLRQAVFRRVAKSRPKAAPEILTSWGLRC